MGRRDLFIELLTERGGGAHRISGKFRLERTGGGRGRRGE